MSKNYSANQFESAYKPKTLRNWEIPKLYPTTPTQREGKTKIIANDRGHILPEIKKVRKQPWGGFISTWNLPRKIDKRTAECLNENAKDNNKRFQKFEDLENEAENDQRNNKVHELEPTAVPYVPGDLTYDEHRPDNYDELAKNRFNNNQEIKPSYPKPRDDFSKSLTEPVKSLDEQVQEVIENCDKEMVSDKKSSSRILTPIISAISNFNLAKKLHKENLEHDPLPDTITDAIYRKLQIQRKMEQDPGLMLEDKTFACGVGWKGYPGYGPTRCTKLKVYRPKTCAHHPNKKDLIDDRPNTAESFERKWRFIRQNKVSPINLAICWDLTPEDPEDEPKPAVHIDGSNGSQAPAVFSLVHTPKDENEKVPKCEGVNICGPIFDHGAKANEEKDFILDRPKTSVSKSRGSNSSGDVKRAKSAYDLHEDTNDLKKKNNSPYQSTPNLNKINGNKCADRACTQHSCKKLGGRLCVACELKNLPGDRKIKTEYKMAFKAGVPQKYKHRREDYPEHWRLTTVYQHSYKPIQLRKRSLLQTVYK
ncbi:uncharacterized protein [Euwallacea fornicatus]|uniref:uncharacterized protein isoform X2 n=1 Tax=Euwallacea fornicatus TaxID=995702 RepID=UPI00338FB711